MPVSRKASAALKFGMLSYGCSADRRKKETEQTYNESIKIKQCHRREKEKEEKRENMQKYDKGNV